MYEKEIKRFNNLVAKVDVISFDIFDTLLIRPYLAPCDLFRHIEEKYNLKGFMQERILAEKRTRYIHRQQQEDINIHDIYEFANNVELDQVKDLLQRQIDYNFAIATEGLNHHWGACVGQTILKTYGDDVKFKAKAYAAAGSDARMSGCEMPVIINSGSGNQGMTASLPVIVYAREFKKTEEELYRALIVSNLCTIHQKTGIGRLSAYCGAVSAGIGAGCGIAYLLGGDYEAICHTMVNGLAIVSGIICDGAKPSCAGKIAASVDAGILGYYMYKNGCEFKDGEGLVLKGVENTIRNIGELSRDGMKETDKEIIKLMCR